MIQFKATKEWFIAALVRAIKTMAQTMLGMITVGAAMKDFNWSYILSVAAVAGIYSMLTSIVAGCPEAKYDGTLVVNYGGDMQLQIDSDEKFKDLTNGQKQALFKVDSPATKPAAAAANA